MMNELETVKQNDYHLIVNGVKLKKRETGALEWSDNIDGLSTVLTFQSTLDLNIQKGLHFVLMNGKKELVRGILTDKTWDKELLFGYTGFDYGFYINKNEVTRQFNKVTGTNAIKQLLKSINVPIGTIDSIPIIVDEIYTKQTVAAIIQDICEQAYKKTGTKYYIKINYGKVHVQKFKKIKLTNTNYALTPNSAIKLFSTLGSFNMSESIQDMKNQILITAKDGDRVYTIAKLSDAQSINRFGLLQMIEEQDKSDPSSNRQKAKYLLDELNKVKETINAEMLGIDEAQSGVILDFDYPKYKFKGSFLITSSTHKVSNDFNHKMNVNLERV